MTIAAIALFIETWGPSAMRMIPVLQKLYADIEAGRGQQKPSAEDFAELMRLYNETSDDIYKSAGVTPPPGKTT